ncbi:MAG: helix-turn-helix transcriptional regulator [Chlorobium sp.]|nr:MAG: helix-turn-helix transcriptional regulator [Chlorobium sp.]
MMTSLLKQTLAKISPYTKQFVKRQGEFAIKINELLEETGMTQRELAETLGKQESYISRVLSGWANPTLKTIVELEVALGKDVIDIPLKPKAYKYIGVPYFENSWEKIAEKISETPTQTHTVSSGKGSNEWDEAA